MEKYIVFGPIILFFIFFILLLLGFIGLIGKLFMKGKNQSWKGEVIKKAVHIQKDNDTKRTSRLLSLKIQLENGEIHSIPATVDFYNSVDVGDKLEKKKGELWPKKI